jgi:hypothetical protein
MTTQEQAYIEGFVKRAAEYGFNENEAVNILKEASSNVYDLEQQKASPLMNILGAMTMGRVAPEAPGGLGEAGSPIGGLGGSVPLAYNAYQDLTSEKGSPSRTANISGGTFLGDIAGGAAGYGLSHLLGQTDPEAIQKAISSGRLGGRALGAGLGVRRHNQKLDEMIDQTRQEQGW